LINTVVFLSHFPQIAEFSLSQKPFIAYFSPIFTRRQGLIPIHRAGRKAIKWRTQIGPQNHPIDGTLASARTTITSTATISEIGDEYRVIVLEFLLGSCGFCFICIFPFLLLSLSLSFFFSFIRSIFFFYNYLFSPINYQPLSTCLYELTLRPKKSIKLPSLHTLAHSVRKFR
jgi:hypothetical protein